jgi:lipoprotein-anchoring transpeptidase ErfK/SrfK
MRSLSRNPWLLFLAVTMFFSAILLPIFLLGGTYLVYLLSGRVFPGVTAGPITGGDLTQAEMAEKIDGMWNRQKTLSLTDGVHAMPVAPLDVGLWVDPQATSARAMEIGRGPGALNEIFWMLRFGGLSVEPVVVFSPEAARAGLQRLAAQIDQPAQNAALHFGNGQWVAVPGKNGSSINIDQTLQRIAADPGGILTGGRLTLVIQPVAPQVSDLTPALARLRGALDQPLNLQAYDPITDETIAIDVPREILASWVTVSPVGSEIAIGLDGRRLAAYLDEWKAGLEPSRTLEPFSPPADLAARWQDGRPVTVMVYHNPFPYTVETGDTLTSIAYKIGMPYWKIQQANPGLDPDHLSAGQALIIPSKNEMLPLPVVPGKRIVISISQQRLWTYENGQQTGEHIISTGIDRSPTIPGVYQIQTHELEAYASVWDLYMPHFMGIYEGWPGFMNGLHGLPTLSGGRLLWAGNLGRPVSYGCIILGLQEAQDLYGWAEEGVVVEIQP